MPFYPSHTLLLLITIIYKNISKALIPEREFYVHLYNSTDLPQTFETQFYQLRNIPQKNKFYEQILENLQKRISQLHKMFSYFVIRQEGFPNLNIKWSRRCAETRFLMSTDFSQYLISDSHNYHNYAVHTKYCKSCEYKFNCWLSMISFLLYIYLILLYCPERTSDNLKRQF